MPRGPRCPEKHRWTKQHDNIKKQKQTGGYPQALVSASLYECDCTAYDENAYRYSISPPRNIVYHCFYIIPKGLPMHTHYLLFSLILSLAKAGRPIKTGRIKICSRWSSAAIEDKAKQRLMTDLCKICFLNPSYSSASSVTFSVDKGLVFIFLQANWIAYYRYQFAWCVFRVQN